MPTTNQTLLLMSAFMLNACIDITLGKSDPIDTNDTDGTEDSAIVDTGDTGVEPVIPPEASQYSQGWLKICAEGVNGMSVSSFSGEIVDINSPNIDCSASFSVRNADGSITSYGISIFDPDNIDVTPALDLELGQAVHGTYRQDGGWYIPESIVLEDDDGLVLIGDQGLGNRSLSESDTPVRVRKSPNALETVQSDDCLILDYNEVIFEGDTTVSFGSFEQHVIQMNQQELTAYAIASLSYQNVDACGIMDLGDSFIWALVR